MVRREQPAVDFEAFSSRFAKETDRACAVLGAAFLDAGLEDLYRRRLAALQEELLKYPGPLASFSSRISLAYSLSWIDENTFSDLNIIRGIRNDFAHSFDHDLHFGDQSIADRCRNIRSAAAHLNGFAECGKNNPNLSKAAIEAMRNVFTTPRWRFQIAVESIAQLLRQLPATSSVAYAGPDLVAECYAMSARIRMQIRASGTVSPPPSPPDGGQDT